jgi:carboxylesterase type B
VIWIHGGEYHEGTSALPVNLSRVVQASEHTSKPIIVVSFNYRLAAWGFIPGNEIAAEGGLNNGLQDQRLLLHWVKENIAAFGGDPEKVTIWGESA